MQIRSKSASAAIVAAAVLAAGCSTTQSFVDYSRGTLYSTETVGNVPYVEVGPVSASARGFFWESCGAMAEEAVTQLKAEGEVHGGNTVSAVRWLNHADGTYSEEPTCTTGWGWGLMPPVIGFFMPWIKATEVKGRLVYIDDSKLVPYRTAVAQRAEAWQVAEAARVAAEEMSEKDKEAKEAAAKAEEERLAAEKLAAEQAAADKAAADAEAARIAAEKAEADKLAAAKAEAEKAAAPAPKKRKKKAAAPATVTTATKPAAAP